MRKLVSLLLLFPAIVFAQPELKDQLSMIRVLFFLSFCCIFLSSRAGEDPLATLKKGQPQEVAELIERLVGCSHWAGEEPYDAERKKEIADALKELKCDRLSRDEAAMRNRYANRPRVIEALKKSKEWSY